MVVRLCLPLDRSRNSWTSNRWYWSPVYCISYLHILHFVCSDYDFFDFTKTLMEPISGQHFLTCSWWLTEIWNHKSWLRAMFLGFLDLRSTSHEAVVVCCHYQWIFIFGLPYVDGVPDDLYLSKTFLFYIWSDVSEVSAGVPRSQADIKLWRISEKMLLNQHVKPLYCFSA